MSALRLGLDATSVSSEGKGIARVQQHVVSALAQLNSPFELVAFARGPASCELVTKAGVRCIDVGTGIALRFEQWTLPRLAARLQLSVVLTTSDRLPLWGRGRYVIWFFEVPTHRIEQNRTGATRLYQRLSDLLTLALWKRSLRRAARVVASSEATAAELRTLLPDIASKLSVIYPGLTGFSPGPATRAFPYLFHLASMDPRDNTETVLEAFRGVATELARPPALLIAGGLGARREFLEAEARRLGIDQTVTFLGRVSDHDLIDLYRGATAYLDASLFEGFGYQVLEAMSCGAPVIAARTTSIPELVGNAGLLCEPTDATGFAAATLRICREPELASELRRLGLERASTFTWERSARSLLTIVGELH